jgi:mono/diheme cytochrome c family protein
MFALALLPVCACNNLPPSKPLAELTPRELAGRQVFLKQCAECHYANSQQGLHGPGLEGIFRKSYLPSGMPANDERVTSVILHGRNMMPAFGNNLSDPQLEDLLAYLHTL